MRPSATPAATTHFGSADAVRDPLLRLVDAALCSSIVIAPLVMGGRHPWGRLVLVFFACVALCGWLVRSWRQERKRIRLSGAEWLILGGMVLVALQLIPLPGALLSRLAPAVTENLSLWTVQPSSPAFMGSWQTISLVPQQTAGGLVMFLSYAALFFVLLQRLEKLSDIYRCFYWCAIACSLMAVIGLLQYVAGNGRFLWLYEHPFRDTLGSVKGTFVNSNHFAHFLALGLGTLMWALHRAHESAGKQTFQQRAPASSSNQWLAFALPIALGVVMFAGLLSFSRGGAVALGISTVACVAVMQRMSLVNRRLLIVVAATAVILCGALFLHGSRGWNREIETVTEAESFADVSNGRMLLWTALGKAIPQFWVMGSGVGTHRDIYRTYFDGFANVEFSHAESGFLQILLENGAPGFLLALAAIGICLFWCIRSIRDGERSVVAAVAPVLGALLASFAHSITDFVWYIPACFTLTVVAAACACRLYQLSHPEKEKRIELSSGYLAVATCVALAFSLGMLSNRMPSALASPHWDAYLKLSLASNEYDILRQATGEQQEAVFNPLNPDNVELMVAHLEKTLAANPRDARAHLRMATLCLRYFELRQMDSANAMGLTQIRDAALGSEFPSLEAQRKWLDVAVGDNLRWLDRATFHTWHGLHGSPFQGEGYIYLAELSFLHSQQEDAKFDYVEQALQVRPYSGRVLFAAGGEAVLAGETERALTLWRDAFHRDPQQRKNIVAILARPKSAKFFLEQFEPDVAGLQLLYQFYKKQGLTEDMLAIGRELIPKLEAEASKEEGIRAARLWSHAKRVQKSLGNIDEAVVCARNAVQAAPDDYRSHRELAVQLVEAKSVEDAIAEIRWCLRRRPDDQSLRNTLEKLKRRQFDLQTTPRISQAPDTPASPSPPAGTTSPLPSAPLTLPPQTP